MNCEVMLRLGAALCAAALSTSGCGGGGGENPKLSLTIAGQVVLTQLAEAQNAHVTATVGARSFETNTTPDGSYQLVVEADPAAANQLVTISARGQSAQQSVIEIVSYISSLQAAVSDAGADGRLTAEENVRANVTSVSTAEAALADEAATAKFAKALSTGTQLAEALAELDGNQVLDTAAAIKLIAEDPGFSLPQGQASTLTFARDQADREQFIADVQADPASVQSFEEAKSEIVADDRLVATVASSDLPNPLFISTSPVDDSATLFNNRFVGLTFETSTTGRYFDSLFNRAMTWSIDGTQLIVTLDQPAVFPSYIANVNCDGDAQLEHPVATDSFNALTLAFLGGRTVSVLYAGQTTYADCPGHPTDPYTTTGGTTFGPDDFGTLTQAQFANRTVALPVPAGASELTPTALQSELFEFGATTGTTQLRPDAFTWSIQQGALVVDFGGGAVYTYKLIASLDSVAGDFLVDVTDGTTHLIDAGLAVVVDEQLDFVGSEVPARYFLGGLGNPGAFALRLDPDGGGSREGVGIDSSQPFNHHRWILEPGGDLLIRRYFDASLQIDDCDPVVPECLPYDERRIDLINKAGARYYWLEIRLLNDDGSPVGESTPPAYVQVRREDRVPLSGKVATRPLRPWAPLVPLRHSLN